MSVSFGGLASGLDTNGIIDKLISVEAQPQLRLARQQRVVQARQDLLRSIATNMQALRSAANDLRSAATWASTQSVGSSDASRVAATLTGGAGPGGYQVAVSQLARAEQHTYTYTTPAAADSIAVGSWSTALAAGTTLDQAVAQINADSASPVYAVAVSGQLVLASRTTGTASAFTATSGALAEDVPKARAGLDAQGTVDGVAFTSSTNTVTTAIPGLSLSLQGVTTVSGPVTVNVGAPGIDRTKIQAAVKTFVDAYNTVITQVQARLREQKVVNPQTDSDALKGVLFGDSMLSGVVASMRATISDPLAGSPASLDQMSELGVSTGATTGTSAINPNAVQGLLTLDVAKLSAALDSDPVSVRRMLAGDTTTTGVVGRLTTYMDSIAGAGGAMDGRVDAANREITQIRDQISTMQTRLDAKRKQLQARFTAMETALSKMQSQGSWLSSQIGSLPGR